MLRMRARTAFLPQMCLKIGLGGGPVMLTTPQICLEGEGRCLRSPPPLQTSPPPLRGLQGQPPLLLGSQGAFREPWSYASMPPVSFTSQALVRATHPGKQPCWGQPPPLSEIASPHVVACCRMAQNGSSCGGPQDEVQNSKLPVLSGAWTSRGHF